MGITLDRGYWHFVKRVPKRFAHVDPRQKVTRALWTDSEREARIKAAAVEAEIIAHWDALAAGNAADAKASYDATRRLSMSRGFPYRPLAELADGPINDILERLEALATSEGQIRSIIEAGALLGVVGKSPVTTMTAL